MRSNAREQERKKKKNHIFHAKISIIIHLKSQDTVAMVTEIL